jgi:hypothetical protein
MPEPPVDPALRCALDDAYNAYRGALADYQGGLVGEDEARRALFRSGLVLNVGEAWLLDFAAGRWWRYDGLALDATLRETRAGASQFCRIIDALAASR